MDTQEMPAVVDEGGSQTDTSPTAADSHGSVKAEKEELPSQPDRIIPENSKEAQHAVQKPMAATEEKLSDAEQILLKHYLESGKAWLAKIRKEIPVRPERPALDKSIDDLKSSHDRLMSALDERTALHKLLSTDCSNVGEAVTRALSHAEFTIEAQFDLDLLSKYAEKLSSYKNLCMLVGKLQQLITKQQEMLARLREDCEKLRRHQKSEVGKFYSEQNLRAMLRTKLGIDFEFVHPPVDDRFIKDINDALTEWSRKFDEMMSGYKPFFASAREEQEFRTQLGDALDWLQKLC